MSTEGGLKKSLVKSLASISLTDIDAIGPENATKLSQNGISSFILFSTPVTELVQKYGIPRSTAIASQNQIRQITGYSGFISGYEYFLERRKLQRFTTGIDAIDDLFFQTEIHDHGIECGEIYELFGPSRSGKTQFCHQIATTIQLPHAHGGIGKKAIYIDVESTFSPSRIISIARRFINRYNLQLTTDDFLQGITFAKAQTTDIQIEIINKVFQLLSQKPEDYGLLIVDSLMVHFRAEFSGKQNLVERQQKLNGFLSLLTRISETFNLAIVVTNQVKSDPEKIFGNGTTPIGGNIMAHWSTHRCYLRNSKQNARIFRIYDSPSFDENETMFKITENGLEDL